MQTDRTTKLLLFAIAVGLWVNILRPAFTPREAVAQQRPIEVNIVEVAGISVKPKGAIPIEGGLTAQRPVKVVVEK